MRVFCAIAVRNDGRYLPGFLDHLRDHVDGIVALDDSSTDDTRRILEREPAVASVLREDNCAPPHANETRNRYRLTKEAQRLGANWLLCLDGDERVETRFFRSLRKSMSSLHPTEPPIHSLRLANLWNSDNHFRLDGPCQPRWAPRLFRIPEKFTERAQKMHQPWHPPEMDGLPSINVNAFIYHLRMIHRADRVARFVKFKTIDPHDQHQAIGYYHLVQERGLKLKKIMPWRQYEHDKLAENPAADCEAANHYLPCLEKDFDTAHYLANNEDVNREVNNGAFKSAWDQFQSCGKFEDRLWRKKPFLSINLPPASPT